MYTLLCACTWHTANMSTFVVCHMQAHGKAATLCRVLWPGTRQSVVPGMSDVPLLPCVTAITHDKECLCRVLHTTKLPNNAFFVFCIPFTQIIHTSHISPLSHIRSHISPLYHTHLTHISHMSHTNHMSKCITMSQVHHEVTSSTTEQNNPSVKQNNPSVNTREAQIQIQPFTKCPTPSWLLCLVRSHIIQSHRLILHKKGDYMCEVIQTKQ
jgi:hypothetical protein